MRLLLCSLSRNRSSLIAAHFQSGGIIFDGFSYRQPARCIRSGQGEAHVPAQESIECCRVSESRISQSATSLGRSVSTSSISCDDAFIDIGVDPTLNLRTFPGRASIQRRLETSSRIIPQDFLRTFFARATNSPPGGTSTEAPRVAPGDLKEEDEFTAESLERLGKTAQESFGSDHEFTATLNLKLAQAYLKEGHSDEKALEAALKAWKVRK